MRGPLGVKACFYVLLFIFVVSSMSQIGVIAFDTQQIATITVDTDKQVYYLRETVNASGTFTDGGQPVTDVLVGFDIRNPRDGYVAFRTLPIGNPDERWPVEFVETAVYDMVDNLIESAEVTTIVRPTVTLYNTLGNDIDVYATVTVYDGTLIPLYAAYSRTIIPPTSNTTFSWSFYIPEWAFCGNTLIFYNVYSDLPKNEGMPYAPEASASFTILRNPDAGIPHALPVETYNTAPGQFDLYFKLSPDQFAQLGTYTVYATGRISPGFPVASTTTFNMQSYPTPPQAAFTYQPLELYQNMTVLLDASSSSAEGFNDTIIKYEWTINDPYNPETIVREGTWANPPSPLATHTFEYGGAFIVDLNVTDNEGLWSTTSKPVYVMSEFGPTANFTWTPDYAVVNSTVIFNASSSEPGWSAVAQEFSPIVSYEWNFSDGTGIWITSAPTITHNFTQPNNYTVSLEVIDGVARSDTVAYIVEVHNVTGKAYDVVEDGVIDLQDIFAVILAYGSSPGDPHWNPRADINQDNYVDLQDLFQVILHYGEDP